MVVGRGAKPDGLAIVRNQKQTLLSIRISAAVVISVIVYPPTLQFVTISFSLQNARAYCTFYIYLAKPLSNTTAHQLVCYVMLRHVMREIDQLHDL